MSTTSFPLVVLEESLMDGAGPGHPWFRAAALERSPGPGLSHPDVPWGAAARPLVPQGSGLSGVVVVVCCGPSDCDVGRALCSVVVSSYFFLSPTPVTVFSQLCDTGDAVVDT